MSEKQFGVSWRRPDNVWVRRERGERGWTVRGSESWVDTQTLLMGSSLESHDTDSSVSERESVCV